MPSAKDHIQSPLVKMMLIGHSGSGKTGALTSLALAGYKIHVLDFDNGLDALINHVKEADPKALANIDYMSFRDKTKIGAAGPTIVGAPKAFTKGVEALDKWEDGTVPSEWGPDHILILDSLTNMGKAAFAWARQMNPGAREPRQWYFAAQTPLEDVIANLTSDSFNANVIVMSHIDLVEQADGTVQGFASALGKALGPKIPRYFNTMAMMESSGQGKNVKRKLKTFPTATVGTLKNPAPMKIEAEYPIETGLATLFDKLRS